MSPVPPYDTQTVRDWVNFQRYYDPFWQTIYNGAVRMSSVDRDLQEGEFYYGLRVPEGRRLVLYSRNLKLTEGVFTVDVVVPSDGFSGGNLAVKARLNPQSPETVQADLYSDVTPSGDLEIHDQDLVDTGAGQGASRLVSGASLDDVVVVITGEYCLRVNSEGGDPYSAALRLIAWEEDDPGD